MTDLPELDTSSHKALMRSIDLMIAFAKLLLWIHVRFGGLPRFMTASLSALVEQTGWLQDLVFGDAANGAGARPVAEAAQKIMRKAAEARAASVKTRKTLIARTRSSSLSHARVSGTRSADALIHVCGRARIVPQARPPP